MRSKKDIMALMLMMDAAANDNFILTNTREDMPTIRFARSRQKHKSPQTTKQSKRRAASKKAKKARRNNR